ncbi:MAG: hypothetical protein GF411_17180 [Candidatus Lokiarchaeota archaeon]|nr:hypothetical protein [Candidatus Lokiarchaeota archaeon]
MSLSHPDLKNIVEEWLDSNADDIVLGLNVESPNDLLEYERNLFLLLMQLGALIMAWILKTRLQDPSFQKYAEQRVLSNRTTSYRHATNPNTSVNTLFGNTVKLKLRYFLPERRRGRKRKGGKRGKRNGVGVIPALDMLGIQFKSTPALASEVTQSVIEGPSMGAAKQRLLRRCISFDIKTLRRISESFAAVGLKIRDAWLREDNPHNTPLVPECESLRGKRVLISMDGGRVRIRKNKRGRISKKNKRHKYNTDWQEPKLIMIRTITDNGEIDQEFKAIVDGTIEKKDAIYHLLNAHLLARDIQYASHIHCTGDGAHWIWNLLVRLFDDLGLDSSKITCVVDFYHAVEHLSIVADGRRGWNKWKRGKWMKRLKRMLKKGDVEGVIDELKKLARGRNAKAVKTQIGYFEKNKERMRYNVIKEKKLPIGSGAIESVIRQVINMRLKNAGTFWNLENAEGFLHLRSYLKGKRWKIIEQAVINHPLGG